MVLHRREDRVYRRLRHFADIFGSCCWDSPVLQVGVGGGYLEWAEGLQQQSKGHQSDHTFLKHAVSCMVQAVSELSQIILT